VAVVGEAAARAQIAGAEQPEARQHHVPAAGDAGDDGAQHLGQERFCATATMTCGRLATFTRQTTTFRRPRLRFFVIRRTFVPIASDKNIVSTYLIDT
jgi:hypothetical protein